MTPIQLSTAHHLRYLAYPNKTSRVVRVALVSLFALLWTIWSQPHTIVFRYSLLTIGSLLGLFVIFQNVRAFKSQSALPIYLIGLLLAWILFHLFFLSHQYELQLKELLTIWKRIIWGAPFAIGLGFILGPTVNQEESARRWLGNLPEWWIFYIGLLLPSIVYLIRSLLVALAKIWGWGLPDIAMHMPPSSTWHIPKMAIVFFCIPPLAIACGQLVRVTLQKTSHIWVSGGIYVSTIAAVLAVFYLESAKNGMAYSVILIGVMLLKIMIDKKFQWTLRGAVMAVVAILAIFFVLKYHIERSSEWKTFFADVRVAAHLEQSDAWKDYGARGYPRNKVGAVVSETNYTRAAWAQIAVGMIAQMPLGYGLVYTSFGHLAKEKWPNSTLVQCHSAWLDLTLGIGLPGVFLLLLAGAVAIKYALQADPYLWGAAAAWSLSSIALLMITTEVSHSPYIEALLFLVLWATGIGLNTTAGQFTEARR